MKKRNREKAIRGLFGKSLLHENKLMPPSKDVLLVNPWIFDFTAYDFWLKPLGLLTIASILREYTTCRVHFIDCLDRDHPRLEKRLKRKPDGSGAFSKEEVAKPEVLKFVPRKFSRYGLPVSLFLQELEKTPRPELVLMTCTMTYWYPGVQLASEFIRKKWGRVPIVLGGLYATLVPGHARSHSGVDVVVEGPGEKTILPLVEEILGSASVHPVEFARLDDLPIPAHELLRNRDVLPLLTSRGCPFRCSYCATPLLFKTFEQRTPSAVVAEVGEQVRRLGVKHFAFYDDALLLNKESHIIPILEGVIEQSLPLSFHTPNGLHVREIDFPLASLLKRAGFRSLYLSQESFDEKLVSRSCPKTTPLALRKALQALKKAGFPLGEVNIYLLCGLPGQEVSSVKESILEVKRLGARPRLAFYSPIPGTKDWAHLVEMGYLTFDSDPLLHNKLTFPYLWGDISPRDLEDLKSFLVAL